MSTDHPFLVTIVYCCTSNRSHLPTMNTSMQRPLLLSRQSDCPYILSFHNGHLLALEAFTKVHPKLPLKITLHNSQSIKIPQEIICWCFFCFCFTEIFWLCYVFLCYNKHFYKEIKQVYLHPYHPRTATFLYPNGGHCGGVRLYFLRHLPRWWVHVLPKFLFLLLGDGNLLLKKVFKNVLKLPEPTIFAMEGEKVNLHLKRVFVHCTFIEHVTL